MGTFNLDGEKSNPKQKDAKSDHLNNDLVKKLICNYSLQFLPCLQTKLNAMCYKMDVKNY